jgi:hypothetical protein
MTNKTILNEGLDYHDLEGQMLPVVTVDEYAAHMGEDSEIVTLAFTVKSEAAGNDLADWFERGYDWVLDSQVSEGEVKPGQYLVFVEMNRRTSVPKRIIELIDDPKFGTGFYLSDSEDVKRPIEEIKYSSFIIPASFFLASLVLSFLHKAVIKFKSSCNIFILNKKGPQ